MSDVTLARLQNSLKRAWSAATSFDPAGWTPKTPSYGQCAVTACIVQDYLGGDIEWGEAMVPGGKKISHFFNRVNRRAVDLTRDQFPAGSTVPIAGRPHPAAKGAPLRDYILANADTRRRYEQLSERVRVILAGWA